MLLGGTSTLSEAVKSACIAKTQMSVRLEPGNANPSEIRGKISSEKRGPKSVIQRTERAAGDERALAQR